VIARSISSPHEERLPVGGDDFKAIFHRCRYNELRFAKSRQVGIVDQQHGHCNATNDSSPKLAKWVLHQRDLRRQGQLDEDRIRLLDDLGFVWNVYKQSWDEKFNRLQAYKQEFGDCNVPLRWSRDPTYVPHI
jgi:hypothetical protein